MPRHAADPTVRFWSKVNKTDGCWTYTGGLTQGGYGQFYLPGGRNVLAHRFSYELAGGVLVDGLVLDHLCSNPACVRPDHLEQVTHAENVLRSTGPSALNRRKTQCIHGHPFDDVNTCYTTEPGRPGRVSRQCRACRRENQRAYLARKRAS